MSAKKNTAITADKCIDIMHKNFTNSTAIEWCGENVTIKRTLPLDEMVEFVSEVVNNCYTADTHTYRPEVRDFTIRTSTMKHYTNIELPEDTMDMYLFLYHTDIYSVVYEQINKEQFHEMLNAIAKKVDAFVGESISAAGSNVIRLIDQINSMVSEMSSLFRDVNQDDIMAVINAIASGDNMEENLLSAYQRIMEKKASGEQ